MIKYRQVKRTGQTKSPSEKQLQARKQARDVAGMTAKLFTYYIITSGADVVTLPEKVKTT